MRSHHHHWYMCARPLSAGGGGEAAKGFEPNQNFQGQRWTMVPALQLAAAPAPVHHHHHHHSTFSKWEIFILATTSSLLLLLLQLLLPGKWNPTCNFAAAKAFFPILLPLSALLSVGKLSLPSWFFLLFSCLHSIARGNQTNPIRPHRQSPLVWQCADQRTKKNLEENKSKGNRGWRKKMVELQVLQRHLGKNKRVVSRRRTRITGG